MLCEPSLPGAPVLRVGSLPAHRALCGVTFPRHTDDPSRGRAGPVVWVQSPTSLRSSLITDQGQKGSWLGLRAGGWGRRANTIPARRGC